MRRWLKVSVLPGALLAFGCAPGGISTGAEPEAGHARTADAGVDDPSNPDPVVEASTPPVVCSDGARDLAGPRLLRRLTGPQFERTVRAVFGLSAGDWPGHELPPDAAAANGFTNDAARLVVNQTYAQRLDTMAQAIGALISAGPHLTRLLPCARGAAHEACANTYLDTVGRRLYRRPLTAPERARYLALLTTVLAQDDFATWVRWATTALLLSPHTVYRSELGDTPEGGHYPLTGFERATALSYAFRGEPPSDALLDRAAAGDLRDPAGVRAAAEALVFNDGTLRRRVEQDVLRFMGQWMGLSSLINLGRSAVLFADFSEPVKRSMRAEFDTFVQRTLLSDGGFDALLTAEHTYLDDTLSAFYGYGAAQTAAFESAARPAGWGVGLLALGAVQTVHAHADSSSPTKRGLLVRTRLLCDAVPPPPPAIAPIPSPTGARTTRERYEDLHAADPACSGCHRLMDPIGYGFEGLDAVGRFRAQENGFDIDATGQLVSTSGQAEVPFDGPTELAEHLAADPQVAHCFTAFLASYTYGLSERDTRCMVHTPADAFAGGARSVGALLVDLATTPHFLQRR